MIPDLWRGGDPGRSRMQILRGQTMQMMMMAVMAMVVMVMVMMATMTTATIDFTTTTNWGVGGGQERGDGTI